MHALGAHDDDVLCSVEEADPHPDGQVPYPPGGFRSDGFSGHCGMIVRSPGQSSLSCSELPIRCREPARIDESLRG